MKRLAAVIYIFEDFISVKKLHNLSSGQVFVIFVLFDAVGQKISFVTHIL